VRDLGLRKALAYVAAILGFGIAVFVVGDGFVRTLGHGQTTTHPRPGVTVVHGSTLGYLAVIYGLCILVLVLILALFVVGRRGGGAAGTTGGGSGDGGGGGPTYNFFGPVMPIGDANIDTLNFLESLAASVAAQTPTESSESPNDGTSNPIS
jgi:hypothetical protein